MNDTERKEYLKKLLAYIEQRARFTTYNFELLLSKLRDETNRETKRLNDLKRNHYLNNLRQTIDKQADNFQRAKEKDKHMEYSYFIQAFKHDIEDELMRMEHSAPTNENQTTDS